MKKQLLIPIAALLLASCSNNSKSETELMKEAADTTQTVNISREILDEMMQTLPSPIEMANLITQSKGGFKKELLTPSENAENFSDKYSQALALGAYGVDLGYLNLNDKMLYVIEYLESINTVSKALKVDQFLNVTSLSNMAKNKNNADSMIQMSTRNFQQIDEFLRSQNRGDLSVLILIGSWLEGLNMFNGIALQNPNQDIINRIGEQKIIIDNIYAILNKIDRIAYYKELKNKMGNLKKAYENVKIAYVYKEPEMKEVNGELVITDNSEAIVSITPQDLASISKAITQLRNELFL
jgi:hypothetical protein